MPGNDLLEEELEANLLALLDGKRDHAALAAELNTSEQAVRTAISRLAAKDLTVG